MILAAAAVCGMILDFLFADPGFLIHPVVIMGKCITGLEKLLRSLFPKTDRGEFAAGIMMAVLLPAGTFLVTGAVCFLTWKIHPVFGFAVQTFWCWQALAVRGLCKESRKVYDCLEKQNLSLARIAVGRIVGRDTAQLSPEGVTKAAVETVAENFSDGVIAPLFFMMIGGAPFALTYKAVNTMDSMCGYKNKKYLYYGRAAARADDVANLIPARIAAILWIAVSFLMPYANGRNAWRIWKRDRYNHASPNSAQTESACAGSLGIQLAGPAFYFGAYYDKPYIGDADREVEPADILRTNRLMVAASLAGLIIFAGIRLIIVLKMGRI